MTGRKSITFEVGKVSHDFDGRLYPLKAVAKSKRDADEVKTRLRQLGWSIHITYEVVGGRRVYLVWGYKTA